jgi:hypothetical protein
MTGGLVYYAGSVCMIPQYVTFWLSSACGLSRQQRIAVRGLVICGPEWIDGDLIGKDPEGCVLA